MNENETSKWSKETFNAIKFDEKGLVTAVAQDVKTGEVLMVAYMNKDTLIVVSFGSRGFYAEYQPNFEWNFTQDLSKAKIYKSIKGASLRPNRV